MLNFCPPIHNGYIFNLAITYNFSSPLDTRDLDENLQKAFLKYLEIRGIKPSMTNHLYEYMLNKDSKEYLVWLKNLKEFIQA